MKKIKLRKKLPQIIQERHDWCIPASIEIALKYLLSNFSVSQSELWSLLKDQQPSFGLYKKILEKKSKFSVFSFTHWGPGTIDELKKTIEKNLKQDFPILISTPAVFPIPDWHIRVCYQVSDDELVMYDPGDGQNGKEKFIDIKTAINNKGGGDILIISQKR